MTDREKVIMALECRLDINGSKYKHCLNCDYRHNIDHCQWACQTDGILEEALALLKAQEPIEARLNLCDSCTKLYPECDATVDGIEFGCGVGNDNIIGCTAYENRWKAQEPVEPVFSPEIEMDMSHWDCGACGGFLLGNAYPNAIKYIRPQYCSHCGRKLKWE